MRQSDFAGLTSAPRPYTQGVDKEETQQVPAAEPAVEEAPATPVAPAPAAPLPLPLDAIIVGAGVAGLACALDLTRAGLRVQVLEASDAPGGRMRTDVVDGFRLDRGFQVLLTDYPEAKRVLDYDALILRNLVPGALVRQSGSFHRFADPYRELKKALSFAMDPIVPLSDKLKVRKLRADCLNIAEDQLFNLPEETTREFLRRSGFSQAILERFFEPFFGGVFLERNLSSSARWFRWLFRVFSTGFAAVPELGMEEIPRQLANRLAKGVVRCATRVTEIEKTETGWRVETDTAGSYQTPQVVMAAREQDAKDLLGKYRKAGAAPPRAWNRTTTIYYAASEAPVDEPVIVLNGDGPTAGPVNHLAVMSLVAPAYAPPGAHLICANIVGIAPETDEAMETLEADVRTQLRRWFGNQVNRWAAVGGYPIAYALPSQSNYQRVRPSPVDPDKGDGIVLCGDYTTSASIQGALVSGARASVSILSSAHKSTEK